MYGQTRPGLFPKLTRRWLQGSPSASQELQLPDQPKPKGDRIARLTHPESGAGGEPSKGANKLSLRRVLTSSVALLAIAGVIAVCAAAASAHSGSSTGNRLLVGVLAPLTGPNAAQGEDMVRATKLAVNAANKAGGIRGQKIELDVQDDQCTAQVGAQAAEKLVSDGVVAVVGAYCSAAALPEENVFVRSHNIPFILTVASNPKLTAQGYTNVIRMIGTDAEEAPADVYYMNDVLKLSKVAILGDGTAFSLSEGQAITSVLQSKTKIQITSNGAITPGQSDYTAALLNVAKDHPEALYYTGFYTEFALIVKQWAAIGKPFKLIGGVSTIDSSVLQADGSLMLDKSLSQVTYPTTQLYNNKLASAYKAQYVKSYHVQPGPYSTFQYDGTLVLIQALKKSASTSPSVLDKALRAVKITGTTGQLTFNSKTGDRPTFKFFAVRGAGSGSSLHYTVVYGLKTSV